MPPVETFILTYYPQIVAIFTFVVWAIRLESKVNTNTSETKRLESKIDTTEKNRIIQRAEDMGIIHTSLRDIQNDLKQLLIGQYNGRINDRRD